MAELKPCPFCGSHAEVRVMQQIQEVKTITIQCTNHNCGMSYPNAFTGYTYLDPEECVTEKLAESWNRRYEDDNNQA